MPDLFLFYACLFGGCPLLIFGALHLLFRAVRDRFVADEAQFLPLPSDDQEPTHAARPFGR